MMTKSMQICWRMCLGNQNFVAQHVGVTSRIYEIIYDPAGNSSRPEVSTTIERFNNTLANYQIGDLWKVVTKKKIAKHHFLPACRTTSDRHRYSATIES